MKLNPGGLALVLSSNGPLAMKAVYCLHDLGYRVAVATQMDLPGPRRSRYVAEVKVLDRTCFDQDLLAYARALKPAVLMPVEVAAFATAARLKEVAPDLPIFPCSGAATLDILDNKASFTGHAARLGVPVPASIRVDEIGAGLQERLACIGYPLMLKTLYGESSLGVVRADSYADVERLLRERFRAPFQAQAFVEGPTVGLNVLCVDGEIATASTYRKHDSDTLIFEPIPQLQAEIAPLLRNLRFSGLANFDAILTDKGQALFLECNPRVWYNMQADCHMGLNFAAAGIMAIHGKRSKQEVQFGPYTFPLRLLKDLARVRVAALRASRESYRGLWQVVSDLRSHLPQRA